MVIAYIYCRVSSKEQSNQCNGHVSLEAQEHHCREYAENKGWTVGKVVKEVSSGRDMKKLHELRSLVRMLIQNAKKTNERATLLINNVSRYSRNTLQGLMLIAELNKHKISLIFTQENIDMATGAGRHTFRILLSNAEYESDMISERVRRAFNLKREMGSKLGKAPYGYRAEKGMVRKFILDDYEQNVISLICELHKAEKSDKELLDMIGRINPDKSETYDDLIKEKKRSYHKIADILNFYKILKRGKQWNHNMISNIIRTHPDITTGFNNLTISKSSNSKSNASSSKPSASSYRFTASSSKPSASSSKPSASSSKLTPIRSRYNMRPRKRQYQNTQSSKVVNNNKRRKIQMNDIADSIEKLNI